MIRRLLSGFSAAVVAIFVVGASTAAWAEPFTVSYLDGSQWNDVIAQGFSPSVEPNPNPGVGSGHTVYLNQFEYFSSGEDNGATDIRLAIINNFFADIEGLSTGSALVEGLSTNAIPNTTGLSTGDSLTFDFDSLPLTYGNNYAAVLVNMGGGGELTPIVVRALTADYVEDPPASGTFIPETNYGGLDVFEYSVSNFVVTNVFGSFFTTFDRAGDANFVATLVIPEPGTFLLAQCGLGLLLVAGRRRG